MGNPNRACDWPQCSCKTEQGEPCKHDDPDFHIRKAQTPPPALKAVPLKKEVGVIDLTPTWQGVLPLLIAALEDGTPVGKEMAQAELLRMAKAADAANGR